MGFNSGLKGLILLKKDMSLSILLRENNSLSIGAL